jgi:hypothetical protein
MPDLTLSKLQDYVRNGAAARSRVILQPAGGEGTKIIWSGRPLRRCRRC